MKLFAKSYDEIKEGTLFKVVKVKGPIKGDFHIILEGVL